MHIGSLRVRLLFAAALAIAISLIASAILLARLFDQNVENRVAVELQTYLNQIIAGAETGSDGTVQLTSTPADQRFMEPYGGLYWQLDVEGGQRQRSRSLWDVEIKLPADALAPNTVHRHEVPGPRNATLFAVERSLTIEATPKPVAFRIMVAVDRREIDDAGRQFRGALARSLVIVGTLLVTAFGIMLQVGLAPLRRLSAALRQVHSGRSSTIEGSFPSEVQALVSDVNRLLEQQRQSLKRAREQAGDLAHGFKTPLAVLSAVARDLRREGRAQPADEIATQLDVMERHVRRELARARTAGASAVEQGGVAVVPVLEKVVGAMRRIAADRELDWSVRGDASLSVAGDEADLLEIVGNLCENASKWARSKVEIDVRAVPDGIDIRIGDDGPGIAEGAEVEALRRGKRLDENAEGSGLGLAIVARAVAAYDGRVELNRSPLGGLEARIVLPAAGAKLTGK